MRPNGREKDTAERVSAAVDGLLSGDGSVARGLAPQDGELLETASDLARLPVLLGPVDPALEQQVMRHVRVSRAAKRRWSPRFRPGWAAAAAALVLLFAVLVTPLGQTAMAGFMAVFNLGRTEVSITPASEPSALLATAEVRSTAVPEALTLESAGERLPFSLLRPAYLPTGYQLRDVTGYTFPDLPAWLPQPFSVELVYADEGGSEFTLRLYPVRLGEGDRAATTRMNLEAAPIQAVREVDVNGQPGVLLQVGSGDTQASWQEVVWEQADLVAALSTSDLSEEQLLRVARSVR